jgi:hypothetical protein
MSDLEIVLGIGLAVMIWVNHGLNKEIRARQEERERFIDVMIDVADKRKKLVRRENGVEAVLVTMEKDNAIK